MGPTERVWEGRLHLGDEPGVYGDASYVGLAVELPVTLHRMHREKEPDETVEFIIETQDVRVFQGYQGHRVTLLAYDSDPNRTPEWHAREVGSARMERNGVAVKLAGEIPTHVSVRIQVDTDVGPGLFDDFVLRKLSIRSKSHYASLGFRFGD